ncbi:2-succinyl-5-enolpyruvyl-6-hydroxy-3-cyclohexene-1-carboxylic-acid synthase [Leifsonia sp. H3M29-4]|uniref:2-succinyl-5-enolpyruvyl-6-hydroxy-3- cyclohexene-1-carboxylic-acid synthase n=1 Tax=Salinibacterium metalliresistens TaxID=3031321 RepID=UPI0023DAA731|nr:2-succinyl-5-enolpyruvyl-6-hydroxy-3-cyclohexene-1-carboxylic-acid synthase [Salinibacterium metalliresistens]MDF1477961.1 2-succinyl-5-enolpyruvyl-6-hydroxy-3-cyclohexene-1-carboxylic-acid synthase [Salinibacterium metalliresistens]
MTRRPATESPATDFAVALLDEFVRLGVRDIVLGPGSRSQALALAAAEFERLGLVRLRVRVDERVGGFLALGLAVETGRPVIVITTSGTAVANLHPAVLEAYHSGVPLIVVTADRPESLRGVGSNQTTNQPGIFGSAVRHSWDVGAPTGAPGETDAATALARDALAAASGPVHLNLAFAEPLSAPLSLDAPTSAPGEAPIPATTDARSLTIAPAPGTIVVAGTGAGERAESLARELGAPLIAEVASGAHFGPNLVVAYRALLAIPEFSDAVDRVIVLGHPTLSREVPALIQRDGVETIVVRGRDAEDYNPGHAVAEFVDALVVEGDPAPRSWAGPWIAASRELIASPEHGPDVAAELGAHVRSELAAVRQPVTRRSLVEAVWRATWPHDRLVVGASRLIREMDKVVTGKKIPVHANRGLAGIDGTISTALGIALASQDGEAKGTTRVLLGDLALLHDAGALLFGAGEVRPRIQVIVGNDGGGTIFDGLEVARSAGPAFDRVLLTRQEFDLQALAAAYGWQYVRVENRGALDQALTASLVPTIVEVPLPRE